MNAVQRLIERWRQDAKVLRANRHKKCAERLEDRANELEQAIHESGSQLLTLAGAARVCGYTADHLGRLIREGKLFNHGRARAPRVRLGDLPRKPVLPSHQVISDHVDASRVQIAKAITTSAGKR